MNYKLYYLNFSTPVHFGGGSLWDSNFHMYSDSFFSALCKEALKINGESMLNKLVKNVQSNSLLISDLMPHINNELWIPKPIYRIAKAKELEEDFTFKNSFKKLDYIPLEKIEKYINGDLNPIEEVEKFKQLGKSSMRTRIDLVEGLEALPYDMGVYTFSANCGLYFITAYKSENELNLLDELLNSLKYNGIGGKVSSGLGKFTVKKSDISKNIVGKLNAEGDLKISLSVCMALENELDTALENAEYKLVKRSGFISSETYADGSNAKKKKDFYMFKGGSCFRNSFNGNIFDVSGKGKHPVYRYGKPLFLEVNI